MLAHPWLCVMPWPDHTLFMCCKDLPQLRSLYLSWASPEAVASGDTLMELTQLESLELHLSHFSALQQLPPHVTYLGLCTWNLLDMATAPCLQSCSGLHSLELISDAGVRKYAVASQRPSNSIWSQLTARLAGFVNFQVGDWPALTKLTLCNIDGNFRLRHWPPLEATSFGLPGLAELDVLICSDATGLLQLEHTTLGLMLNTLAPWHRRIDRFSETERPRCRRTLFATRRNNLT